MFGVEALFRVSAFASAGDNSVKKGYMETHSLWLETFIVIPQEFSPVLQGQS